VILLIILSQLAVPQARNVLERLGWELFSFHRKRKDGW